MFVTGVDRSLRADFELAKGPLSDFKQALEVIREKLIRWDSYVRATYGQLVGVVVNSAPHRAVRFDIDIPEGAPTSTQKQAYTSPMGQTPKG